MLQGFVIAERQEAEEKNARLNAELTGVRNKLLDGQNRVADVENALLITTTDLQMLRQSTSWQLTYPLRLVSRLCRWLVFQLRTVTKLR